MRVHKSVFLRGSGASAIASACLRARTRVCAHIRACVRAFVRSQAGLLALVPPVPSRHPAAAAAMPHLAHTNEAVLRRHDGGLATANGEDRGSA